MVDREVDEKVEEKAVVVSVVEVTEVEVDTEVMEMEKNTYDGFLCTV